MLHRDFHKTPLSPGSAHTFQRSSIADILGIPFSDNNQLTLLKSGRETFQRISDLIASAKHFICVEFYIFSDDYTGRKLADLLRRKSKEGITVYLLYDHFGSLFTARSFWSQLKKAGIKIRVSHPFRWSTARSYLYRNHKKMLIVDGTRAVLGGMNIADEYHGFALAEKDIWRDTGILLEGPVVSTLFEIFRKSWRRWKAEPISWTSKELPLYDGVSVIPVFAHSGRARRRMRRLYLYSINHAQQSILLTTAYFIPERRILKSLKKAAQRGVEIKLLLPGKTDVISAMYAGRAYYQRLLRAGIHIYIYKAGVLHAKTAVFDGSWSIIGSTNLDYQSFIRNEESNIGILDHIFGAIMMETFNTDVAASSKIVLEEWERRPVYQKILERFFAFLFKKL